MTKNLSFGAALCRIQQNGNCCNLHGAAYLCTEMKKKYGFESLRSLQFSSATKFLLNRCTFNGLFPATLMGVKDPAHKECALPNIHRMSYGFRPAPKFVPAK